MEVSGQLYAPTALTLGRISVCFVPEEVVETSCHCAVRDNVLLRILCEDMKHFGNRKVR